MGLLEDRVREELKAVDVEDFYIDMLDDSYSFSSVGGPFKGLRPSHVLKAVDLIAYNVGMNDWLHSENLVEEIDGKYYIVDDVQVIRDEIEADENGEN